MRVEIEASIDRCSTAPGYGRRRMMTADEFGKATDRYLPRLTATAVPFYIYHADHKHLIRLPVGSGVLFGVAERRLILTARHIIDKLTPDDRLVIANHVTGTRFTIAAPKIIRGASPDLDLMLVPLDQGDLEKLQGKSFVGLESLALTEQDDRNVFMLFGYPQELAQQTPNELHALALSAQLMQSPTPSALKGFLPKYHLLLEIEDRHIRDDRGQFATLPELSGISGGGVWRISRQRGGEVDLIHTDALQLMGIETGFYRDHASGRILIKIVSAQALVELLYGLGDDVRDAMARVSAAEALRR
jgi:hypothetical protein